MNDIDFIISFIQFGEIFHNWELIRSHFKQATRVVVVIHNQARKTIINRSVFLVSQYLLVGHGEKGKVTWMHARQEANQFIFTETENEWQIWE